MFGFLEDKVIMVIVEVVWIVVICFGVVYWFVIGCEFMDWFFNDEVSFYGMSVIF